MRYTFPIALWAAVVIAGCASPTPYRPANSPIGPGYGERQIEADRWSVRFTGNALTDRQTVEAFLLYRAAELTHQSGYDYFQIVTRETDSRRTRVATGFSSPFLYNISAFGPTSVTARRYRRASGFNTFRKVYQDPFFGEAALSREEVRFDATAEVLMGRGETPDAAAFFDAQDVLVHLSSSVIPRH